MAGIRVNDRAEPLPLGRRRKKARGDGLCRAEWGARVIENGEWKRLGWHIIRWGRK